MLKSVIFLLFVVSFTTSTFTAYMQFSDDNCTSAPQSIFFNTLYPDQTCTEWRKNRQIDACAKPYGTDIGYYSVRTTCFESLSGADEIAAAAQSLYNSYLTDSTRNHTVFVENSYRGETDCSKSPYSVTFTFNHNCRYGSSIVCDANGVASQYTYGNNNCTGTASKVGFNYQSGICHGVQEGPAKKYCSVDASDIYTPEVIPIQPFVPASYDVHVENLFNCQPDRSRLNATRLNTTCGNKAKFECKKDVYKYDFCFDAKDYGDFLIGDQVALFGGDEAGTCGNGEPQYVIVNRNGFYGCNITNLKNGTVLSDKYLSTTIDCKALGPSTWEPPFYNNKQCMDSQYILYVAPDNSYPVFATGSPTTSAGGNGQLTSTSTSSGNGNNPAPTSSRATGSGSGSEADDGEENSASTLMHTAALVFSFMLLGC